jgi:hypothetical protein
VRMAACLIPSLPVPRPIRPAERPLLYSVGGRSVTSWRSRWRARWVGAGAGHVATLQDAGGRTRQEEEDRLLALRLHAELNGPDPSAAAAAAAAAAVTDQPAAMAAKGRQRRATAQPCGSAAAATTAGGGKEKPEAARGGGGLPAVSRADKARQPPTLRFRPRLRFHPLLTHFYPFPHPAHPMTDSPTPCAGPAGGGRPALGASCFLS